MTLIKRYSARLHTAFWGPPMCTEEIRRLEGHREEEQLSETKKAVLQRTTQTQLHRFKQRTAQEKRERQTEGIFVQTGRDHWTDR